MQIHQHLWKNGDQPSSNVLAALIRLLRRKIEASGETPLVHTVHGKGYRLVLLQLKQFDFAAFLAIFFGLVLLAPSEEVLCA